MKIYISHGHDEGIDDGVRLLSEALQHAGHEPVSAAQLLHEHEPLQQAIKNADALVFVVDRHSGRNRRLQQEWSAAVEESWSEPGKAMIPILVGDVDPPPFLRDRQAIRVNDDWENARSRLLATVGSGVPAQFPSAETAEQIRQEQRQRFSEIAQEAARLEPDEADREAKVRKLEEQLARLRQQNAPPGDLADQELRLADALKAIGRNEDAVSHLRSALALLKDARGSEQQLVRTHTNLARSLENIGQFADALAEWQAALDLCERVGGSALMATIIHASLAALNDKLGNVSAAEEHRKAFRSGIGRFFSSIPVLGPFFRKIMGGQADEPEKKSSDTDSTSGGQNSAKGS